MKKTFFISLIGIAFLTSPAFSTDIFNPNESNLLNPPVQVNTKHPPENYIVHIAAKVRTSQGDLVVLTPHLLLP